MRYEERGGDLKRNAFGAYRWPEVVDCQRNDSNRTPRGTKTTYHCACSTLVDHRIPNSVCIHLYNRGLSASRVSRVFSRVVGCRHCRLVHADSPRVSVRVLIYYYYNTSISEIEREREREKLSLLSSLTILLFISE